LVDFERDEFRLRRFFLEPETDLERLLPLSVHAPELS